MVDNIPVRPRRKTTRLADKGAFRTASLASYLDVSEAAIARLDSAGVLPKAIRLQGCKLWSKRSIDKWLAMGCPTRQDFETLARQGGANA